MLYTESQHPPVLMIHSDGAQWEWAEIAVCGAVRWQAPALEDSAVGRRGAALQTAGVLLDKKKA